MVESNDAAVEALAKVLAELNVAGWRLRSEHACDGTEEVCMISCPVPAQEQVGPAEIIAAILASGVVVPATERCSTCQQSRERCESTPRWGGDDHTFTPDFKQPAGSAVDELRDIKAAAMTKTDRHDGGEEENDG